MLIQAMTAVFDKIIQHSSYIHLTKPIIEQAMGVTYAIKPTIVFLGRLVTIIIGVATVAITYFSGKQLTKNVYIGLAASLLVAISPTTVSLNRLITPDSYAAFFSMVVLLASIYVFQRGGNIEYAIAGLGFGLAISSKYNSGTILVIFLAAHFLRSGIRGFKDIRLYLTILMGLIVFVLLNPYALLDFSEFQAGFISTGQHYATGHAGMEGEPFKFYLEIMWLTGGLLYILSALEIIRGIITRSRDSILLSSFVVVYFTFINLYIVRNERTFFLLVPFLCLLSASFFVKAYKYMINNKYVVIRKYAIPLIACIAGLTLYRPVTQTIDNTASLTKPNNRETARVWIMNNLPQWSKIALESYSPFIDPKRYTVYGFTRIIDNNPNWYIENSIDYLIFCQGMFGRYYYDPIHYPKEAEQYNSFFSLLTEVKVFPDADYEVRIYKLDKRVIYK